MRFLLLFNCGDYKTGPFGSTLHADDYVNEGIPIITTEHFKNGQLPTVKDGIPQVAKKFKSQPKKKPSFWGLPSLVYGHIFIVVMAVVYFYMKKHNVFLFYIFIFFLKNYKGCIAFLFVFQIIF